MADRDRIEDVAADGGDGPVTPEQLQGLKEAARVWDSRAEVFWQDRVLSNQTRFCHWTGQSADGRLHAEAFGGREIVPFEGASDQRVRWADALVLEQARMMIVALCRAQPRCEGRGKGDQDKAKVWTAMARWAIDMLAGQWLHEHEVLLNYMLQDTPAVAAMSVTWKREMGLELETMTAAELAEKYVAMAMEQAQQMGVTEVDVRMAAQAFAEALADPERGEEELAGVILQHFEGIRPARARKVVRQLRKDGVAEFPVKRLMYEGPAIQAMRFGDDFVMPDNTQDFQRSTPWFRVEWLSEAELRGMVELDGWDEAFVKDVLGQEGVAIFKQFEDLEGVMLEVPSERHKGRYQVARAYYWGTNEDDVPARYETIWHPQSDKTAWGRRLLREKHGKWPAVLFQREVLTKFVLDSRGIPELIGPAQGIVKGLHDSGTDAGTVWALPPILAFGLQNHGNQYLEPMRLIQGKRDARFEPVQAPPYPVHVREHLERIEAERDWYFGRARDGVVDPQLAATAREALVVRFLAGVRDVIKMIVALCQQNADDELLARITDRIGQKVSRTSREIQGEFDVRLVFDPADMDFENVIKRATATRDVVLAIDTNGTVDRTPFAQGIFRSLYPYMADDVLRPVEQAEGDELKDEARNLTMIRAGVLPQLDTEGNWNYQLRFDWYTQKMQENPGIFDDMGQDKKQLLTEWLKGLQQQAEQFGRNKEIGRTGMEDEKAVGDGL